MTRGTPRRRDWRPAVGFAFLITAGACSSPVNPTPPPPPAGPTLTCPADISASSADGGSLAITYPVPVASGGVSPVTVACNPAPDSLFPPGTTPVNCTATDQLARTATCAFSVKVSVPPRLRLTRFMAFGDSTTSGKAGFLLAFGVEDYPGSYPTRLAAALSSRYSTQTVTMSKQGWPGEETAEGMARLADALSREAPQVLLLLEGANDLSDGNLTSVPIAVANVRDMVRRARLSGVQVFLATLPPQKPGASRARGAFLVPSFNEELAEVAKEAGAVLVDLYTAMLPNLDQYIDWDGLHPTQQGYQKIAETFQAAIQTELEIPGTTAAGTGPQPLLPRRLVVPPAPTGGTAGTRRERPAGGR